MTVPAPKILYDHMLKTCGQRAKKAGYSKQGSLLRKIANGNAAVIQFQKSIKSSVETILFTINLGIVCGRLLDTPRSTLRAAGVIHAHLRERLGMLLPDRTDKWWSMNAETDVDVLVDQICSLIESNAVPYLDGYLTDEALIDLWQSGQSPGLTELQRSRFLMELTAARASL